MGRQPAWDGGLVARIRSIKPEFFTDPKLARVSVEARFLFIGVWTEADDEGKLLDSAKLLAGSLFPHDKKITERVVEVWLKELEKLGVICRYAVESVAYILVTNWHHQKIAHPTRSRIPNPSGEIPEVLTNNSGEPPENFTPDLGNKGTREQGRASDEASHPPALDLVASGFLVFWAAFPNRHGKKLDRGKCETRWAKLSSAEREAATSGALNYGRMCTTTGTLAKDPDRWLRDRCWVDWQNAAAEQREETEGDAINRQNREKDAEWEALLASESAQGA